MTTPLRQPRRLSRDTGSARRNPSQTGLPMATSRNQNRQATTQPTYDFLAGGNNSPPKPRTTIRRSSSVARPDSGNEDSRAQLKTLQYELDALKQEREVTKLKHEKEVRDAQSRAEADFKRAQASESNKNVASHKYDALARELQDLQDSSTNKQHELEKRLRSSQDQSRSLQEEVDEAQSRIASLDREQQHKLQEIESKHQSLQNTVSDVRAELEGKSTMLQTAQKKLERREKDFGALESEVLSLKAQSGDAEELGTVRRELSEQVEHIRRLEKSNREQNAELRNLRQTHKATAIVEEEKRVLEIKVQRMDDLERELGEARFQRQFLEDEKKSWMSFLQNNVDGESPEFDSPEAVARALAEERLERASLAEQLGAVQPEVTEKKEMVKTLEIERTKLKAEMEKLKTSGSGSSNDSKAKTRAERQKTLALKEIEYLRAQLKAFEAEDATGDIEMSTDEHSQKRITDLEDLVAEYRSDLENLTKELSSQPKPTPAESLKRPAPEDTEASEQLGQLSRKNRKLQTELQKLTQKHTLQTTELSSTKEQLLSLQTASKTRVLSLRSNPTDDFQLLKYSTIQTLREENSALHAQLAHSPSAGKLVPSSSLAALTQELSEARNETQSRDKTIARLKQVFSAKALELREAISSILGWKVEILANGKFRLTSLFNPGPDPDNGDCNFLTFDGEKGTVQVSGGPNGAFARELKGLMRFWVEERKEIPAFMAAATMEFYEATTRAQRA